MYSKWLTDKCIPLVQQITYANAEVGTVERKFVHQNRSLQELVEKGLPLLLLFHHENDTSIVDKYSLEVARQLHDKRGEQGVTIHRLLMSARNSK